MPARDTLSDLIRRLRRLIGDPAPGVTWTDDQDLQDTLDGNNQSIWRNLPLRISETRSGGTVQFLDWYSTDRVGGNWEADCALIDGGYNVIDPESYTADLVTGHFHFTEQPAYPIYITGKTYDLYGAAADLLEEEATMLRRRFDVTEAGGASAKRSQMIDNILKLAAQNRAKARPKTAKAIRSDTQSGFMTDAAGDYQAVLDNPF